MGKIKTVANLTCSRMNSGVIKFNISDEHSGDNILELSMSLKEFALLVTGLGGIKAECDIDPDANIAKKRITERAHCDKVLAYKDMKQAQKDLVKQHFEENILILNDGWEIHSDGTTSQQNNNKHEYIIKKYAPVEDVLNVERWY